MFGSIEENSVKTMVLVGVTLIVAVIILIVVVNINRNTSCNNSLSSSSSKMTRDECHAKGLAYQDRLDVCSDVTHKGRASDGGTMASVHKSKVCGQTTCDGKSMEDCAGCADCIYNELNGDGVCSASTRSASMTMYPNGAVSPVDPERMLTTLDGEQITGQPVGGSNIFINQHTRNVN